MTLRQFYPLLCRHALVRLESPLGRRTFYAGTLQDVPDEYDDAPVRDFGMEDSGRVWFRLRTSSCAAERVLDAEADT